MKSFAAIAFLTASANAFTGTPLSVSSVSKSTELKMSVWDTYQGGVDFRGKEFKFDPVSCSDISSSIFHIALCYFINFMCTYLDLTIPHSVHCLQLKLSETYTPLVPFFRESELRHGRTAMLAVVGFVIPEFFRLPGDAYSFEAVGKVADAHNALIVGPMHQLLLWISLWDIVIGIPAITALNKGEREAGGK